MLVLPVTDFITIFTGKIQFYPEGATLPEGITGIIDLVDL